MLHYSSRSHVKGAVTVEAVGALRSPQPGDLYEVTYSYTNNSGGVTVCASSELVTRVWDFYIDVLLEQGPDRRMRWDVEHEILTGYRKLISAGGS